MRSWGYLWSGGDRDPPVRWGRLARRSTHRSFSSRSADWTPPPVPRQDWAVKMSRKIKKNFHFKNKWCGEWRKRNNSQFLRTFYLNRPNLIRIFQLIWRIWPRIIRPGIKQELSATSPVPPLHHPQVVSPEMIKKVEILVLLILPFVLIILWKLL